MAYCPECGKNIGDVGFCPECDIDPESPEDLEEINTIKQNREKWVKRITIYTAVWGTFNLIISQLLGVGILLFFTILIWSSKNFKAIYSLGIIWLLLAFFQFMIGFTYVVGIWAETYNYEGTWLIFLSLINFAFGGWVIYRTRKLDKTN